MPRRIRYHPDRKDDRITQADENERVELLETIYGSWQRIHEIKSDLSRPFAIITTLTALPIFFIFLLKNIPSLHYLSDPYEERLAAKEAFRVQYTGIKSELWNTATGVVSQFEQGLLQEAKLFATAKNPHFFLTQLNITGADKTTWPFPWQFAQLPKQGHQHLLFKMAQFIDWLTHHITHMPASDLTKLNNLRQAFNFTIAAIFEGMGGDLRTTPEQQTLFPEYQGKKYDLSAVNMTMQRLAEMIRHFYPYLVGYGTWFMAENNQLAMANESTRKRQLFFLIMGWTMLAKGLLINPIFRKFFPINRCLSTPLNYKINYLRLNLASLRAEEKKLNAAERQLTPYANYARRSAYILNGIILFVCLLSFQNVGNSLLILNFYPLWVYLIGEMALSKGYQIYDHYTLQGKLSSLKKNLLIIAEKASANFKIDLVNQGETVFSYLTVSIISDYQILPAKHVIHLLKITLDRFGIVPIPAPSTKRFSLPANTSCKNLYLIKNFFAKSLQRSLQTYQLEQQVRGLFIILESKGIRIEYEKSIIVDEEGFFQCEFVVPAIPQQTPLLLAFQQLGFIQSADAWVLTQHEAYPETKLKTIATSLTRALVSQYDSDAASSALAASQPSAPPSRRARQNYSQEDKHATARVADAPQPAAPPAESKTEAKEQKVRTWPCGAMFPGPHVKEVAGGTREFVVTDNLTLDDYGGDEVAQTLFSEKSKQKALRAYDAQGIKVRPTLFNHGVVRGNRLKPARVKIVSDNYGDSAVGLDIEKDATGATLYIPMGFQSGGIH